MVTVRVRVSINVILFVLYFMHRYSVDGATGLATLGTRIRVPTLGSRTTALYDRELWLIQLAIDL